MKTIKYLSALLVFTLGMSQMAFAQEENEVTPENEITPRVTLPSKGYYIGVEHGASFGVCTFRSFTFNEKDLWQCEMGFFGGYRFSKFFSLDLTVMTGRSDMQAQDCCTDVFKFYLNKATKDAYCTANPHYPTHNYIKDMPNGEYWRYRDMVTKTAWIRYSIQGNFNPLYFIRKARDSRWMFDISPMVGVIRTQTTFVGNLSLKDENGIHESETFYEEEQRPQANLIYGFQGAVGIALTQNVEFRIYGGMTFLTTNRFDGIPKECVNDYEASNQHTENFLWDAGGKLVWNFTKCKAKKQESNMCCETLDAIEDRLDAIAKELAKANKAGEARDQKCAEEKAAREQRAEERKAEPRRDGEKQYGAYPFSVFFKIDRSELMSENDRVNIKSFADYAKINNCTIHLRGTADAGTGSVKRNQTLSSERCNTVKNELMKCGVSEDMIVIDAAGGVNESANPESDRRVFVRFVK